MRPWFWGGFFHTLPRPASLDNFSSRGEGSAWHPFFSPPPVLRLSGAAGQVLGEFARDNLLKAEWEYVPAPSRVVAKSVLSLFCRDAGGPKNFQELLKAGDVDDDDDGDHDDDGDGDDGDDDDVDDDDGEDDDDDNVGILIDIDDDDDEEDHDDDDSEDDDDVTTTLCLQVWVEVGGGTHIDIVMK